MNSPQRLTAIIQREDGGYVSLCPELDIASQGESIEESRANLIEALTLFFESASPSEIARRGFVRESGRLPAPKAPGAYPTGTST